LTGALGFSANAAGKKLTTNAKYPTSGKYVFMLLFYFYGIEGRVNEEFEGEFDLQVCIFDLK
jgi:hypothetical protein